MTAMPTLAMFGCDVGKDEIVIHDACCQTTRSVPNTAEALARFASALPTNAFIICEATGGYETLLLEAVIQVGRQAHRAHPRKVKAFIRSLGTLAKTDAIDAKALARYGVERHLDLERWQTPDPARLRLHQLVTTRRDFIDGRTAWTNRAKSPGGDSSHVANLVKSFDKEIESIEAEIEDLLRQDDHLARSAQALKAIPGIGKTTAANLIAFMPELGHLDRKTAAALAGLAPYPNQSGKNDGYRRTKGGRPQVKRALFMAAMVASRHNPTLKTFYDRLIANGKKPIVALTAVMRKLVIIANAVLRECLSQQVS